MSEQVILVDENDNEVGQKEKLAAHEAGDLHRAFSVILLNPKGQMLIHKRAANKYHCPGLWTNACCSHPRPSESIMDAAHRRLSEELNTDSALRKLFTFHYKAELENGLIEHEFDHVLLGFLNEGPVPNPAEIAAVRWIDKELLMEEIGQNEAEYTPWFLLILKKLEENKIW